MFDQPVQSSEPSRLHGARGAFFFLVAASVPLTAATLPPVSAQAAPLSSVGILRLEESPSSPPADLDPVPLPDRATESSNTWRLPDGSLRAEVYPAPVNYETAGGDFAPIDNDLVDSGAAGVAVENAANDYTVRLPEDAGSKEVKFSSGGSWVAFQMGGLDGTPVVDGTEATYGDVEGAASVAFEATSAGVKESIILDAVPAAPVSYDYTLTASTGLTPVLDQAGSIRVVDAQSETKFTLPAPYMVDSATPDAAYSDAVAFSLAPTAGGWTLTVTPDQGWLADPARTYPVVIDPTITDDEVVRDCWINDAAPNASNCAATNDYIKVGMSGGDPRRGLVKFGIDELPANNITVTNADALLYLDADQSTNSGSGDGTYVARQITQEWDNNATWLDARSNTPWTTAGGTFKQSSAAGLSIPGGTSGYKKIPATAVVQDWHNGETNRGVVIKQSPESVNDLLYFYSSGSTDTSRWPKLEITYTENTTAPTAVGAGNRSFFTYTTEQLTDRMQARVNVGNGNLLVGYTDLRIPGVPGLDFTLERSYNSILDTDTVGGDTSGLGPGWSHNLGGSVRLEFPLTGSTNRVLFYGPSGFRVRFEKNAAGDYFAVAPGFADGTLKSITGGYEITLRNKRVYKFTSTGELDEIRDKQGNTLDMTWANQKLDYVTDTRQRKIQFTYTSGLLTGVQVKSPAGATLLTYTYTYTGSPARLASSAITQIDSSLVASGGDVVNVDAEGDIKTSYEYTDGRLTRVMDARETNPNSDHTGGTTSFAYYTSGTDTGKIQTVTRETDDDSTDPIPNSVSTYTYASTIPTDCDGEGTKTTTVDGERESPVEDDTLYCVDGNHRVRRTVDPKGHVRKQTWTSQSNVATYDASGLSSGGTTFSFQYDDQENPTTTTSPTGGSAGATYTDTVNPNFPTSMSDFDTGGDTATPTWEYDYDDKGNLIEAKAGVGSADDIKYRYCWDGNGQLTRIDPISNDASGTMSTSLDTNTGADGCNPTGGQGNDTILTYTNKDLTTFDPPGARVETYTYDALSRVKTVTDGRGVTTTFTYDALDHVLKQEFIDDPNDGITPYGATSASVSWTYDEDGNRTSVDNSNDNNSATVFAYDELNRVVKESATQPANTKLYKYDPADNLTTFDDEGDPTVYTYDNVNLVTSIDDPKAGNGQTQFEYDRHDRRTKTTFWMPDGDHVIERAKYNDAGQTTCIYSYRINNSPLSSETADPACPASTATGLITFFDYNYTSPSGFKTQNKYSTTTKGNVKWTYTYDPISRLTSAKQRNGADTKNLRFFEYSYDRHSNLTQEKKSGDSYGSTSYQTTAFNDAEELCWSHVAATAPSSNACSATPTGRITYTHDNAGALATASDGLALAYNVLGQTAQADPAGTATAFDMAYVGVTQDRRIQKDTTRISYGFAGLSSQAPNSGLVHSEWFVRDPHGRLISQIDLDHSENNDRYYLMDDQQSVVATIDTTGKVRRYLYEPFGEEARGSWIDTTPTANNNGYKPGGTEEANPPDGSEDAAPDSTEDYNPWRFASGYYDRETGVLKYGTRYYMPNLARWSQVDPRAGRPSLPLTINPYIYAGDNPVGRVDPSGRDWIDWLGLAGDVAQAGYYAFSGDTESAYDQLLAVGVGVLADRVCHVAAGPTQLTPVTLPTVTLGCYAFGSVTSYYSFRYYQSYDSSTY